jgi:hypothetical protein
MSSQQKVRFFDFVNGETYVFFTWVTEGGGLNLMALLNETFEQVEKDELFEMGVDLSTVAKRKLAALLNAQLCDLLDVGEEDGFEGISSWVCSSEEARRRSNLDFLTLPLLVRSLDQIRFDVAAQAILIREGKWNPDRERPEAI